MNADAKDKRLSAGQERVLKLLYKFRFVSTGLLAGIMTINRRSVYEVVELLVGKGFIDKVYETDFRYGKKPAYYYLSKSGVTTVRKLLDVKESVIHTLYKNDEATEEFIAHCLTVAACYPPIRAALPKGTDLFTKAEINQFKEFPKNRPDLYLRTPDDKEAVVVIAEDKPDYIVWKRLEEIITHNEDEGWSTVTYPYICFILKDDRAKHRFLFRAHKKLEDMGFDEDEIHILAASLKTIRSGESRPWGDAWNPLRHVSLFD